MLVGHIDDQDRMFSPVGTKRRHQLDPALLAQLQVDQPSK